MTPLVGPFWPGIEPCDWLKKGPAEKAVSIVSISIVSFSWGSAQIFGVTNKEHYGMLWYFLEWSIAAQV